MTRVFQLTDSSEGYLAHLYRFVRPHVIVYSLPIWEARDVLDLLKANSFGELAAIIDTTNEKPFTNIISNQPTILIISNSPREFAFSKSKTRHASQIGRL